MHIAADGLSGKAIRALLEEHFADMLANSPEGSCHFLNVEGLTQHDVTFWSIWDGDALAGMGALKVHDAVLGEVKSMRTHKDYLRKGIAARMLGHIIATARARGLTRLSLETGSGEAFMPAIRLYETHGFVACEPFENYTVDPFSRFFTREI
jgi:putative acetyltransferase